MQDRQNTYDDPTLVDRGWEQMRSQLDEVMPVRKRRFFPWWILLVLGFITSLGAFQWISYDNKKSGEEKEMEQIPANNLSEDRPIAQVDWNENKLKGTDQISSTSSSVDVNKSSELKVFDAPKEKLYIPNNKDENYQKESFIAEILVSKEENEQKLSEIALDQTLDEKTFFEEQKQTKIEKIAIDTKSIASLATITFPLLEGGPSAIESEIDYKRPKKSHLIIKTGVEVGLSGNPQAGSLGIAYQHSTHKNFSYELGLNYQAASIRLLSDALSGNRNNDENLVIEGAGLGGPTGNLPTFALNQAYDLMQLSKVNLDLLVIKKLGSRLSVQGGVQTSYYTKASLLISTPSVEDTYELSIVDDRDLYNETISVYSFDSVNNRVNDPYELALSRWQFSALLGAQYRLSKHWGIEANFRKTLTKWPDKRNVYGGNSFVGLGVRYYLW